MIPIIEDLIDQRVVETKYKFENMKTNYRRRK